MEEAEAKSSQFLSAVQTVKTNSTQPSNPLVTNSYRDALEPNPVIPASESETIPLAVVSTSPR